MRRPRGRPPAGEAGAIAAAEALRRHLGDLGEVFEPGEAEEPILGPPVRAAVFEWLTEIRACDALEAVGLKPRATGLLYGPPGCGKTTLAHHLAARLGVPMVLVGPETLIGSLWGASEKSVARLFTALEHAETPCIVFVDEIEAIGGHRSMNTGGNVDNARTSMLTVLLRRIERFEGVFVGATNRPQDLDPALWRRFGLQIDVALPDADARYAILKRYGLPYAFADEMLEVLTGLTEGAAPSLLRQVMEGVKRLLVLGERLRRPAADPVSAFAAVLAQVAPPPEVDAPPLWRRPAAVEILAGQPWPPEREVS